MAMAMHVIANAHGRGRMALYSWHLGFLICLGFAIWVSGLVSSNAQPTPAQIQFFENKIRPILVDNCYKCHSRQAEKVRGGLFLDSREGVLKGGETGPSVVAG